MKRYYVEYDFVGELPKVIPGGVKRGFATREDAYDWARENKINGYIGYEEVEMTNFQMIRELEKVFRPKRKGIIEMDEIYRIDAMLDLSNRSILDLRNLRDFVVLFYDKKVLNSFNRDDEFEEESDAMDRLSAITAVIDNKIVNLGGEV